MFEYSDIFTSREYITVQAGTKIRLRLTDYENGISADEEEFLESVVKSVKIPHEKEEPPKSEIAQTLNSEPEMKETPSSAQPKDTSKDTDNKVIQLLIRILGAVLLITFIPLIIRMFLFSRGLSRGGAKAFAIIYSILVSALVWYLIDKKLLGNIPIYIAFIPLLWSFVIYKIVKH